MQNHPQKIIRSDSRLNIGITFFASEQINKIWSNGTVQNVMFLYMLLKNSSRVANVFLINGGDAETLPQTLLPEGLNPELRRFEETIDQLDVLIDFHVQISPEQEQAARERGVKLVQYKSGNVFVMEIENTIFNLPRPNSLINGVQYDITWTLPHHARTNKTYLETLYRNEVLIMPYIWDPIFINASLSENEVGKRYFYQPSQIGRPEKKRVAILEPNFNIVKTCHYPILIAEQAYRNMPQLFSNVYVNNIEHMRNQKNFIHFTHYLDIVKNNIASFEGRYETPYFLSNHAEIVLTHNWENQMNNLYFDVLYGGYPLVHNSEILRNFGYYYEPFNTHDGARALISAMQTHDADFEHHQKHNKTLFDHLSVNNLGNINSHVDSLFSLFAKEAV
jgi:hypothetical protein